jgi:hypothetical protein
VLRQRVTTDIATKGGQFDVMTIGMYETPIWGKKGWLKEIKPDAAYDVDDLLPAMRNGLSVDGKLYAAPFYGESSMLMYRKDLPTRPASSSTERPDLGSGEVTPPPRSTTRRPGVYGICLRGKPGWGDNMAFLSTMVNSYGGQWFDMAWKPQLESKPWHDAVTVYVDLLKKLRPARSSAEQLQRDPRALQRRQVRDVDRRDDRRPRSSPNRSRARSPTRSPSRRVRTARRRRARTGCGPGRSRFPPARKNTDAAQKFITGRRRRTTSTWSPRRRAGPRCRPARASRPTRTPSS